MKRQDLFISLVLFFIGILSRFPFIEQMQSHWDGPEYSIGVLRYSFPQNTPSAPGYPLYIAMGRFFYLFTHDPHLALLLISVLFSGVGAVVFYISGKIIFNRITGTISSLIFLSGPTFYYFGVTLYAYILLPTMSCLLVLFSYLIIFQEKRIGIILGILFGIYVGIRPQEIIFMSPLILFSFMHMARKEKIKFILAFILTFFVWFIPYIKVAGGFKSYIATLSGASVVAYFTNSFGIDGKNIVLMVKGFFLSFGEAGFFLLYYVFYVFKNGIRMLFLKKRLVAFIAAWILPNLLFNFFITSVHAGYQMGYLTFFLFLSAYAIDRMFLGRRFIVLVVSLIVVGVNLFLFFYNRDPGYTKPYRQSSFHYSDLKRNDYVLSSKVNFINSNYDQKKTIVIVGPVFWRQAMYYLPEYQIFEIDALVTNDYRFKNIRRDAMHWKRREYKTTNYSFLVPALVNTLILFDDESYNWINKNKKVKQFKGMTRLTIVSVKEGDIINYSLGSLQLTSKI